VDSGQAAVEVPATTAVNRDTCRGIVQAPRQSASTAIRLDILQRIAVSPVQRSRASVADRPAISPATVIRAVVAVAAMVVEIAVVTVDAVAVAVVAVDRNATNVARLDTSPAHAQKVDTAAMMVVDMAVVVVVIAAVVAGHATTADSQGTSAGTVPRTLEAVDQAQDATPAANSVTCHLPVIARRAALCATPVVVKDISPGTAPPRPK